MRTGHVHCQNSMCKHYWEDCCIFQMIGGIIGLDENGTCFTFEEGVNECYLEEK